MKLAFYILAWSVCFVMLQNNHALALGNRPRSNGESEISRDVYVAPTGPRQGSRRICQHEEESSTESLVENLTGGETLVNRFFGNERSCLSDAGFLRSDGSLNPRFYTRGRDLNRFYSQCMYQESNGSLPNEVTSLIDEVDQVMGASHLNNRDSLLNAFWQDLAARSQSQIVCRQNSISYVQSNPAVKQRLFDRVEDKFNQVSDRLRELILLKKASKRVNDNAVMNQFGQDGGCAGLAVLFCRAVANERTRRDHEQYEALIAAELTKIPYGYEPDVAEALLKMADTGSFNEADLYNSLTKTFHKYEDLNKYYNDRFVVTNPQEGKGLFCIDNEFKLLAASTGVTNELLNSLGTSTYLSPSQKTLLQCRINSKYKAAPNNLDTASNVAFLVGGGAAAILTAVPTGGGSLATYAAVASLGFSAASFAYQLQKAHAACMRRDFVISADGGAEVCNPEEDFNKEISESSRTECLTEVGFALVEAIPIPIEVGHIVRARRGIPTAQLLEEIVDEAGNLKSIDEISVIAADGDTIVVTGRRVEGPTRARRPARERAPGRNPSSANSRVTSGNLVSEVDDTLDEIIPRSWGARRGEAGPPTFREETLAEIRTRMDTWPAGARREARDLIRSAGTNEQLRRRYLAILLNSTPESNPTAALARLKRLRDGAADPAVYESVMRELDDAIAEIGERMRGKALNDPEAIALGAQRSALLLERTLIDLGDEVNVRGILSARQHNGAVSGHGHSLDGGFNLDLEITGNNVRFCRGSMGTLGSFSGLTGGFLTMCRKGGYVDRVTAGDVLAAPGDATLEGALSRYGRFNRFDITPPFKISMGRNGPVTYDRGINAGTGGNGGGIEFFTSRWGQNVSLDDLAASVRIPTCTRAPGTRCEQIFQLQERIRIDALDSAGGRAGTQLTNAETQTDRIIEDILRTSNFNVAPRAGESVDDVLNRLTREHPDLGSALNLRREIEVKRAQYNTTGGRARFDEDTQALVSATRFAENASSEISTVIRGANGDFNTMKVSLTQSLQNNEIISSFRSKQDEIQGLFTQIGTATQPSDRVRLLRRINDLRAQQEDLRTAAHTMAYRMESTIEQAGGVARRGNWDNPSLNQAQVDELKGLIEQSLTGIIVR